MCAVRTLPTPCSPQRALKEFNNMNLSNHHSVSSGHTAADWMRRPCVRYVMESRHALKYKRAKLFCNSRGRKLTLKDTMPFRRAVIEPQHLQGWGPLSLFVLSPLPERFKLAAQLQVSAFIFNLCHLEMHAVFKAKHARVLEKRCYVFRHQIAQRTLPKWNPLMFSPSSYNSMSAWSETPLFYLPTVFTDKNLPLSELLNPSVTSSSSSLPKPPQLRSFIHQLQKSSVSLLLTNIQVHLWLPVKPGATHTPKHTAPLSAINYPGILFSPLFPALQSLFPHLHRTILSSLLSVWLHESDRCQPFVFRVLSRFL